MRDNKGYNLIEFVIVIAIMAIVVSSVTLSVSSAVGWKARQTANSINSVMTDTKTNALGKDCYEMVLSYDASSGDFVASSSVFLYTISGNSKVLDGVAASTTETIVGNKDLTITAYGISLKSAYTTSIDIKSHSITVSFDRASGKFQPLKVDNSANYLSDPSNTDDKIYLDRIEVTAKNGKTYTIKCVPLTGKHNVD